MKNKDVKYNKLNSKMILIEYRNANDIDVYFPEYNWTFEHAKYNNFKNGEIKCPYEPRVYGVGHIGEGRYKIRENGKITKCYEMWRSMLRRCYVKDYQEKHPTYIGCKVCNEWHNFQNFAEWYYENYYIIDNERMELDKDILVKGNKIYSPETCEIVPKNINLLIVKSNNLRGKYPIGVSYDKRLNKFKSYCNDSNGKHIYLGIYDSPEEAFYSYKIFKEKIIKDVAEKYKTFIPKRLYKALCDYKVEITD